MSTVPVAPPLCNYTTCNDSSPGAQVWDLAAGGFVPVSDATFNSWLSQLANAPVGQPYWPFYLQIQAATSSDGGTTTTFQVDNTSIMTTGAKYNISATRIYDGNQAITVVDGTHVKISVAFAGNATGNLAGAAIVDTAAHLLSLIQQSQLNNFVQNVKNGWGTSAFGGTVDITLTDPVLFLNACSPASGHNIALILPKVNLPTSTLVLGRPVRFFNNSTFGNTVTLKDSSGGAITHGIPGGAGIEITLQQVSGLTDSQGAFNLQAIPIGISATGGAEFLNKLFFAGPSSGSPSPAAPTFRTINRNDITGLLASTDLTDLPIPVSSGGTGDAGAAWSTWTPTITSQGGTITTYTVNNAHYKTLGKTVWYEIDITINTVGTATGHCVLTMPVTPKTNSTQMGGEPNLTGKSLNCFLGPSTSNNLSVNFYDASSIFASGNGVGIWASGVYESA